MSDAGPFRDRHGPWQSDLMGEQNPDMPASAGQADQAGRDVIPGPSKIKQSSRALLTWAAG